MLIELTPEQISDALLNAKWKLAYYKSKELEDLKKGKQPCCETKNIIIQLRMAIFVIVNFQSGENCLSLHQLKKQIEIINGFTAIKKTPLMNVSSVQVEAENPKS